MKIAIIGGGITGLTTALGLVKMGLDCQVYERAKKIDAVGAGIWIQPNAIKVMNWLNIGDAIRAAGIPLNSVDVSNSQLKAFKKTKNHMGKDEEGNYITAIHRAKLQEVLTDALPKGIVHYDSDFKNYTINKDKIIIKFANKTVEADLLLGADGIHSKVRKQLFVKTQTRYTGQTCYRGISKIKLPAAFQNKGSESWGANGRFGFAQLSEDTVYWFAVIKAKEGKKDQAAQRKDKLKTIFKNFHPLIQQLIEKTPTNKIIRHDLLDLKRINSWHKGNICLLGDAGHATTPNMGQGACQGIEDAYYISNILAKEQNPQLAFKTFEQSRRKKVDYVVNNSWTFGQLAHNTIGRNMAILAIKITPLSVMIKQMKKLYTIKKF